MKHLHRFLAVAMVCTALAACGTTGTDLNALLKVVTTPIANPVSATNIYQLKNGYAATLQLAVDWRAYCYSKPYATIVADPIMNPVCVSRRAVVRKIQLAKAKAHSAIVDASDFVQQNPTLDASSVVNAAWSAMTNFENAVPAK